MGTVYRQDPSRAHCEAMRSLVLFCLLAAPSLGSPVSVPAASPEAQPVADPEADASYGHHYYGKRSAEPEPHHGYYGYGGYRGLYGYRGWYGRKKRAAEALPEPVAGPMPQPEADAHYGYYGYGGWGYPYYGYGYYWG